MKSEKGFALTEVLLSIAVIVIIGIVAYPLYRNAKNSAETEGFLSVFSSLRKNVDSAFMSADPTSFQGQNTTTVLIKMGLIPDGFNIITTTNDWNQVNYNNKYNVAVYYGQGGSVNIVNATMQNPKGILYIVNFNSGSYDPNDGSCTKIMTALSNQFDNTWYNTYPIRQNGKMVATIGDLVTYCKAVPTDGPRALIYASDSPLTSS